MLLYILLAREAMVTSILEVWIVIAQCDLVAMSQ